MEFTLYPRRCRLLFLVGATLVLLASTKPALRCFAGGGPENVFLIVNSSSQASKTVANHYVDLRKIPASNVFYVKQNEANWAIGGQTFKKTILMPALEAIEKRELLGQIDYVIYSCGFPQMVTFAKDFPDKKVHPVLKPHGSLTGATYLWAFSRDSRKEMVGLTTNNYCLPKPGDKSPKSDPSITRAFHGNARWLPNGDRSSTAGLPYFLSTMLGVSFDRGNTAEEIVRYLRIAKKADGTHPQGTVYYMKHNGPRSNPRHNLYPQAVSALRQAGVNAIVSDGRFPRGKEDIVGLTVGVPQFSMAGSKCRILPGALCDNLTSFGGHFKTGVSQTPLTDFLVHGAAGASGTVVEPYAIANKFPTPFLHLHYVRGCSMAEAFYQSINAPFQQLIVGDPLCQPWANFPEVSVSGIPKGKFVKGTLTLSPSSVSKGKTGIRYFELFIDGVRRKRSLRGRKFSLDTTTLSDGYHELRVVGVDNTAIETQGRWIAGIEVNNHRQAIQLFLENRKQLAFAKLATVKVASTPKVDITMMHNGRELDLVPAGSGIVRISVEALGSGPIVLQARSEGENSVFSPPLCFELPASLEKDSAVDGSKKLAF